MYSAKKWTQWCRHLRTMCQRSLYVLALGTAASLAQAQVSADSVASLNHGSGASTRYDLINLGSGTLANAVINAKGQVAYTMSPSLNVSRAYFYDGSRIHDLGTLGGTESYALAINDAGQIAGFSRLPGDEILHAFLWSTRSGLIDLGLSSTSGYSEGFGLNNRAEVTGLLNVGAGAAAFRWDARNGMTNLVNPAYSISEGRAIDDNGLIAGHGFVGFTKHALVWPRKGAVIDLGDFGSGGAEVIGMSAHGQVTGNSALANGLHHGFVWTRENGMQDIGTAGGVESLVRNTSANGNVSGIIRIPAGNDSIYHGFLWTRRAGMMDIGTLNGITSIALGVNDKGQVVGWTSDEQGSKAIVWSAADGMVDLSRRLHRPPSGLVLHEAVAIAENGSILATSSAGLLLLKPDSAQHGH